MFHRLLVQRSVMYYLRALDFIRTSSAHQEERNSREKKGSSDCRVTLNSMCFGVMCTVAIQFFGKGKAVLS